MSFVNLFLKQNKKNLNNVIQLLYFTNMVKSHVHFFKSKNSEESNVCTKPIFFNNPFLT